VRRVPLSILGGIVSTLIFSALSSCTNKVEIAYPVVPSTLALRPTTSTTIGPDRSKETLLPPVDSAPSRSTTTVDFGVGAVTLAGRVEGPDGPVGGATVRIERLVGEATAERTVITDDEGRFTLAGVPGGRLRLRAWKVPDIAMARNVVVFAAEKATVRLQAERFASTDVRWAAAPSSAVEGQAVNLVVQVSRRRVDDNGVVGFEQISGLAVKLIPLGALQPDGAPERLTDDNGRASFPMRCNAAGAAQIKAQLASGEDATLDLPACLPLPTTTLPPPPSSELPTVAPVIVPDSTTIAPA
jgi:hypothetical protein